MSKTKDLVIAKQNEVRAYALKRGWKHYKLSQPTPQNLLDMITTMADNNLKFIKSLNK